MFSDGYLSIENDLPLRDESRARRLALNARSPSALVFFRVLLGGVRIKVPNAAPVTQDRNFFVLGGPRVTGFSFNDDITRALPNLGIQDRNGNFLSFTVINSLDKHFQSTSTNKGFFEVLMNEISRSISANLNGNSLSAFVYLYRAIEHISFALPIFHARHARNYIKAFNELKALISTGDAELKFCEKFIKHIFDGKAHITAYSYAITFDSAHHEKYLKYLKGHHDKHCTFNGPSIEVPFLKAFSFVVDVRNKFFHHLSGSNQSASSKEIRDADAFFRPINEIGYSLIGLIFSHILSQEID